MPAQRLHSMVLVVLNGAVVITTKSGQEVVVDWYQFLSNIRVSTMHIKTRDIQTVYGDGPYVGRYDADGDGNIGNQHNSK